MSTHITKMGSWKKPQTCGWNHSCQSRPIAALWRRSVAAPCRYGRYAASQFTGAAVAAPSRSSFAEYRGCCGRNSGVPEPQPPLWQLFGQHLRFPAGIWWFFYERPPLALLLVGECESESPVFFFVSFPSWDTVAGNVRVAAEKDSLPFLFVKYPLWN